MLDWPGDGTRGSMLCVGGRGDFIEKYLEALHEFHDAGWHATSFDWRGQGGSGRLLDDPTTGHIDDFTTWIDDLAAIWSDWVARTPAPHVILAHSMGGQIVLRALAERRIAPVAAVLSAPMLGFKGGPVPQAMAARVAALLGRYFPTRRAWKSNEHPDAGDTPRQALLTRDRDRYDDELWWEAQNPALELGPASWGWVAASFRSFARLAAPGVVEGIACPLLVIATQGDRLVDSAATQRLAMRTSAELVMFDASVPHEVLRDIDAIRDVAMARIARFLDREAPAA